MYIQLQLLSWSYCFKTKKSYSFKIILILKKKSTVRKSYSTELQRCNNFWTIKTWLSSCLFWQRLYLNFMKEMWQILR